MSKDPAFPFYVNDYLVDTMRWSRPMKSLHVDLLAEFWANGGLINEDGFPKGLSKKDKNIWSNIKHKWIEIDGVFINKKLQDVKLKRKEYIEKQSENGKKGGRPLSEAKPKPLKKHNPNKTFSFSISNNNYVIVETTHPLVKFVSETMQVSKLPRILTNEEAEKLMQKYPKQIIIDVISAMENKKDLLKKYVWVYSTINSWCSGRLEKKSMSANSGQGINLTGETANP
jgi:uncharacterized protein YdaU (DUF1376 family)